MPRKKKKTTTTETKIVQLLLLLLLLVCQLEVTKEDVSLVVVRGDDDSFDSIHGEYISIN